MDRGPPPPVSTAAAVKPLAKNAPAAPRVGGAVPPQPFPWPRTWRDCARSYFLSPYFQSAVQLTVGVFFLCELGRLEAGHAGSGARARRSARAPRARRPRARSAPPAPPPTKPPLPLPSLVCGGGKTALRHVVPGGGHIRRSGDAAVLARKHGRPHHGGRRGDWHAAGGVGLGGSGRQRGVGGQGGGAGVLGGAGPKDAGRPAVARQDHAAAGGGGRQGGGRGGGQWGGDRGQGENEALGWQGGRTEASRSPPTLLIRRRHPQTHLPAPALHP